MPFGSAELWIVSAIDLREATVAETRGWILQEYICKYFPAPFETPVTFNALRAVAIQQTGEDPV